MFTEIGIENFKAYGKMQRIPLKPITLLYGPNSSGKSSLMQSLLLLKQTMEESGDDKIVLLPKGNLVDLGGYQEFINGHDANKEFILSISFMHFQTLFTSYSSIDYGPLMVEGEKDNLSLEFSFFLDEQGEILLKSITMRESGYSEPLLIWKNIWTISHLKNIILKRKKEFEKTGDTQENISEWLSNLQKGLLVLDYINMEHEFIQRQWHEMAREETTRFRDGKKSTKPYADKEHWRHKQTIEELNNVKKYIKKEAKEIKAAFEKLTINDLKLNNEYIEERKETLFVRQEKLRQLKKILKLSKIINNSLINQSYENFQNIRDFPISNRLLSLLNCFPSENIDLTGEEDWLFQKIKTFAALGKPKADTPEIYKTLNITYFSRYASSILREYLRNMIYIGPLRECLERVYSYSGNIPSNVGKSGKYTPDILMKKPELVNKVNDWFERFEIGYKLDVDPLKRNLFALTLTDKKTDCDVSPKDIGFGIGQLLPIIVQGVLSESKIICIEQPEIHIHPRLQAEFGSFVAEVASRAVKEPYLMNDEGYGNQFIIETHSEHLILRLLRLIRDTTNGELKEGEKPLRPEDVAVIYAKPTEQGTELMELRISEDGDFIDKWPDGFFTEREKELF